MSYVTGIALLQDRHADHGKGGGATSEAAREHGLQRSGATAPSAPTSTLHSQSIAQDATPNFEKERLKAALGLFAQDQWTINKLTLNLGLRYDYLNAGAERPTCRPARSSGAQLRRGSCLPCWHDIVPRVGAAYDLFGNGKTAVKVNIGKYVAGQAVDIASALHPINASIYAVTRNWNDFTYAAGDPRKGNYVPDCDLTNQQLNGECGIISNLQFGQNNPNATQYADDVLRGWGVRGYNWQFSGARSARDSPGTGRERRLLPDTGTATSR